MSKTSIKNDLRAKYLERIIDLFKVNGEEVLRTASNKIAFPCVDSDGDDQFILITVTVPSGERGGEPYDGYSEAEAYAMTVANKEAKAKEAAAKKAEKIARDKAIREAKAKAKADREKGE